MRDQETPDRGTEDREGPPRHKEVPHSHRVSKEHLGSESSKGEGESRSAGDAIRHPESQDGGRFLPLLIEKPVPSQTARQV